MALTTLPYPNMDFTPLDILTADELDHIVANYTAINNATIATANLANSAVTSEKIDWTNLKPAKSSVATSGSVELSWVKRTFPSGVEMFSTYGLASWWTGAKQWYSDLYINLPEGMAFDKNTMACWINIRCVDSACYAVGCVQDGVARININRFNLHAENLTRNFYIEATLIHFKNGY